MDIGEAQQSPTQANPKRVEDFHHFFLFHRHHFVNLFLLIPNAPGFCFFFSLPLVRPEKQRRPDVMTCT
jgi:hypothetical protein